MPEIDDIAEIAKRLKSQDNRCTADPIFIVQELKRRYGIDTDFDPEIAWLHEDESVEVGAEMAELLENKFKIDGDAEPSGYRRVGYKEEWEYVQPFFTEGAADLYIKQMRTYTDSAYRNWEWIAVRKHLLEHQQLLARVAELELYEKRFKYLERRGFTVHGEHPLVHSWKSYEDGPLHWTATRISAEFKTAGEACDAVIAAEEKL